MKAIVQDRYGSADALELRDIDQPTIGADKVLVRVRAAGVGPDVWHLMTGEPYLVRAMGFGLRKPKVAVRGSDLAGVVQAVGARVTRFHPGDQVYGTCESGSFAEYVVAPERRLAAKPASISFEQAAATPISGVTALQAVRDCGRAQPGQPSSPAPSRRSLTTPTPSPTRPTRSVTSPRGTPREGRRYRWVPPADN
jgi:NADPH:quinone reductase-like Zn-dependent oxidoreductase